MKNIDIGLWIVAGAMVGFVCGTVFAGFTGSLAGYIMVPAFAIWSGIEGNK